MKTNLLRLAAVTFTACTLLACSKEDTNPEPGTGPDNPDKTAPYTITATIAGDDLTRVSMEDDGSTRIDLKWVAGDKIYVRSDDETNTTVYAFIAGNVSADGKTASFTCESFPTGQTPAYAIHQGFNYFSYANAFDPASVSFTISSPATNNSSLSDKLPLWAKYDPQTKNMVFKALSSVLKLKITVPEGTGGNLYHIFFGSSDGSTIFYNGKYDITSGTAQRSSSNMTDKFVYNGFNTYLAGNTEMYIYLPIPSGEELAGKALEIGLIADNWLYSASIKGANLDAGKCYPLTLGTAKWSASKIYEGGTGSTSDPCRIENENNLRTLANAVAKTRQSFTGVNFVLTQDITGIETSESKPWLPIGSGAGKTFDGNFDGAGHTLSGTFHISDEYDYAGLFGYVFGAISNLNLEGDIIYRGTRNSSYLYVGGIAGYSTKNITNCTHTGSVSVENANFSGMCHVGGITGNTTKNISKSTQLGGTISVNTPKAGFIYAGGIAGRINSSTSTMHQCRNESDVIVTKFTNYAGALAGYNMGKVFDCSTFPQETLTVSVGGTPQNPVKAIGWGNAVETCDGTAHPQP